MARLGVIRWLAAALLVAATAAGCGGKKDADKPPAADPAPTTTDGAATATAPSPVGATVTGAIATDATTTTAAAPAATAEAMTGADGRPLYYKNPVTAADLAGRSLRELSLMRNTIWARGGNTFRKPWLRAFFTAQPWYRAQAKVDESMISAIDRENSRKISEQESSFDRAQLEAMAAAIVARGTPSPEDEVELSILSQQLGGWAGDPKDTAKRSPLEDPDQLERLITLDELAGLSPRDLRILRNTVYARRGREFKSDVLQQWFGEKDWYKPDSAFTEDRLTKIDKTNIKLIRSVEDSLGGPMTDHAHMEEEGWFSGS